MYIFDARFICFEAGRDVDDVNFSAQYMTSLAAYITKRKKHQNEHIRKDG